MFQGGVVESDWVEPEEKRAISDGASVRENNTFPEILSRENNNKSPRRVDAVARKSRSRLTTDRRGRTEEEESPIGDYRSAKRQTARQSDRGDLLERSRRPRVKL